MSRLKLGCFAVLGVLVLAAAWRVIETNRTLEEIRQSQLVNELQREGDYRAERAKLTAQIQAVESAIRNVRSEADRVMRTAKAAEKKAASTETARLDEFASELKNHPIACWYPWSDVSKHLIELDEQINRLSCTEGRAHVDYLAAESHASRKLAALDKQGAVLEQQMAALHPPNIEPALPNWLTVFFGTWRPLASQESHALPPPTPPESSLVALYSYRLPDLKLGPAPTVRTNLFDVLKVCSPAHLAKILEGVAKGLQGDAIRLYRAKEGGSLVDIDVGCRRVTLNKPVAEALWLKYQYFLAQTDYRCELNPTSDTRWVLNQVMLKKNMSKSGLVVAGPLESKHVVGDAVDQSARCQGQGNLVPFDFDPAGHVIFVRLDARGRALDEPEVHEAIINRRRAEFGDDYKRLVEAKGDVKGWEAAHYDAALDELLKFPPGMGIYGAHVMSFEAGLKAGLVGAFCGIPFDPIHSELSIGNSKAECGGKLGGMPACYRVDTRGKPDCWRGSPKWNELVDRQRQRFWGERYADLYGPNRLARYLPMGGSKVVEAR